MLRLRRFVATVRRIEQTRFITMLTEDGGASAAAMFTSRPWRVSGYTNGRHRCHCRCRRYIGWFEELWLNIRLAAHMLPRLNTLRQHHGGAKHGVVCYDIITGHASCLRGRYASDGWLRHDGLLRQMLPQVACITCWNTVSDIMTWFTRCRMAVLLRHWYQRHYTLRQY